MIIPQYKELVVTEKKNYQKPVIISTEKLEAIAVVCTKCDTMSCGVGTVSTA